MGRGTNRGKGDGKKSREPPERRSAGNAFYRQGRLFRRRRHFTPRDRPDLGAEKGRSDGCGAGAGGFCRGRRPGSFVEQTNEVVGRKAAALGGVDKFTQSEGPVGLASGEGAKLLHGWTKIITAQRFQRLIESPGQGGENIRRRMAKTSLEIGDEGDGFQSGSLGKGAHGEAAFAAQGFDAFTEGWRCCAHANKIGIPLFTRRCAQSGTAKAAQTANEQYF